MGNNFTDIAVTEPVIASTFNDRLDELDGAIKVNTYNKTAAPTVGDDSADGYTVGSRWIDTTNDRMYIAVDVSAGAAIWLEVGSGEMVMRLPALAFYLAVGAPALGALASRYPTWRLDDAATELVGATFQYTGWKSGANLSIEIYWAMESATSGNVVITARAAAMADGEDGNSTATAITTSATVAVPGSAKFLKKSTFSMPAVNYAPNDLIWVTFERQGGNASDTATGDLHFVAMTVRFL